MAEYVGVVISYVCQIAIILFVAKEFGWIASQSNDSSSKSEKSAVGPSSDIGAMMNGILGSLQGAMKQVSTPPSAGPTTPVIDVE